MSGGIATREKAFLASRTARVGRTAARPGRSPAPNAAFVTLRQNKGLGPARIAGIVGMQPSTVHRVLTRHGLSRLSDLDRATRAPIRRIEMTRPGELVHLDVKKLGRIPKGGGWRAHGRGRANLSRQTRVGYAYVHSAVDGYSRLAFSEVHRDELGATAAGFWGRARAFFVAHGIDVERVLTDNGSCYRSHDFGVALGEVTHSFTRPYRPATNGKVERFNRTLLAEWAYARTWTSEGQRVRALAKWLHVYNHHRHHTAVGGAPISRVSNLSGHYN